MSEEPRKRQKVAEESGDETVSLLQHQNTCLAARLDDKRSQLLRLQTEQEKILAVNTQLTEQLSKLSASWSSLVLELDEVLKAAGCGSNPEAANAFELSLFRRGEEADEKLRSLLKERVSALLSANPQAVEGLKDTPQLSDLQAEKSALLDQVYLLSQRLKEQATLIEDHKIAEENLHLRLKQAQARSRSSELDIDPEEIKSLRDNLTGSKSERDSMKQQRDKYIERSHKLQLELEFSEERFLGCKAYRYLLRQARELKRQLTQSKDKIEGLHTTMEQATEDKLKQIASIEKAEAKRRENLEAKAKNLAEELARCNEERKRLENTTEQLKIELGKHKHATHYLKLLDEVETENKRLRNQVLQLTKPAVSSNGNLEATDLLVQLQNEQATNGILMEELEVTTKAYEEAVRKSKMLMGQLQEQEQNYARMMKERLEEAAPKLLVEEEQALLVKQVEALKAAQVNSAELLKAEGARVAALEHDKAVLEKQLKHLEESYSSYRKSQEDALKDREALQRSKAEAKDAIVGLEARIVEEAAKRTHDLEQRLQLEAAYERAQRELKEQVSLDGVMSTDDLLNAEVDKFRKMVRCGVCSTKIKEVVLTKCYHAFCKDCIDRNLETRKRKCPSCMTKFGQEDVKTFWWK
mmetsp:Transcript_7725/g.14620  ORF Transcript_7725/g.14620 Transcript_7725/m.14620 type:complete len:640 (-) Transcript_7725:4446-6365(-)